MGRAEPLQQPHQEASALHFSGPIVGELVFDKFAPRDLAPGPSTGSVKQEHESPLLDFSPAPSAAPVGSGGVSTADAESLVADHFLASSADSTPLFELDAVESDPQGWNSLFDDDIAVSVSDETIAPSVFSGSDAISEGAPEPQEAVAAANPSTVIDANSFLPTPVIEDVKISASCNKKKSSAGAVQKPCKLDHLGVVTYNRKSRAAPLTPIIPESDDPVAMKRAKNTEAARRSRARKLQRMNQLEDKVEELLKRNTELEQEVASLRALLGGQC